MASQTKATRKFDTSEIAYIRYRESELGELVPIDMRPELHKHIYGGKSGGLILRRVKKTGVKDFLEKITPYQLLQLKRHEQEFRIFESEGGAYYANIEQGVPYVESNEFLSLRRIEYYKLKAEHRAAFLEEHGLKLKNIGIISKSKTGLNEITLLECGLQLERSKKGGKIYINRNVTPEMYCAWCSKLHSNSKWSKCSGCKSVIYCDAACQKNDWGRHKKQCKKLQQILSKAESSDSEESP